jgi:hypothetical protein
VDGSGQPPERGTDLPGFGIDVDAEQSGGQTVLEVGRGGHGRSFAASCADPYLDALPAPRSTGETVPVQPAEVIDPTVSVRPDAEDRATRTFSTSVLVSAVRCTLAYVVFPWLLPAFGLASGVGPAVGLVIGPVAIAFNVASIRRFHASDHRWKWHITALNVTVIVLLTVLLVLDVRALV